MRSTDDQSTIRWLPVVGLYCFRGLKIDFNQNLSLCDRCTKSVRVHQVCPFHPNDRVLPHANIHCCIRVRCNGEGGGRWLQCDILRILTLHSHCELRTMGECISLDQFSYLNPNTNAHCVCM